MSENRENSIYAKDWFRKGDEDLEVARILIKEESILPAIGIHIQQALEKYLKGFLIHHGWELRKIHHLGILLNEAIQYHPDWSQFKELCQRANKFYIEDRYPLSSMANVDLEEYRMLLEQSKAFIKEIRKEFS